jgi:hypothetical protein
VRGNDGYAESKAVALVRFVHRGKVSVRIPYHSIPRAAENFGTGDGVFIFDVNDFDDA